MLNKVNRIGTQYWDDAQYPLRLSVQTVDAKTTEAVRISYNKKVVTRG